MLKPRLLCLAFLFSPLAAAAQGPPPKAEPAPKVGMLRHPSTVTLYSTLYLEDPGLHRELGLTPDQVKKLKPLAETAFQKMTEGGFDPKRRDDIDAKQAEALAAVLSPEQRKRLRQLTLQQLTRLLTGPLTLAADAGVSEALKLTPEQKNGLNQRKRLADVLTPEQKKAWEGLVGKAYPARLQLPGHTGPQNRGPYHPLYPRLSVFLTDPVEQELRLTPEQVRRLATTLEGWYDLFPDASFSDLREAETRLAAECEGVLTPEQRKRWKQVEHRLTLHGPGPFSTQNGVEAVLYKPLIEAWKLTEDQQKKRAAILKEHQDAVREAVVADTPVNELPDQVGKLWSKAVEQLEALLTAEQKTVTKEMLGEPLGAAFQGHYYQPHQPHVTRTPGPKTYLAPLLLRSAFSTHLPADLALDADQQKELRALFAKYVPQATPGEPEPALDDATRKANAEAIAKGLDATLKPKQAQRVRELAHTYSLLYPMNSFLPLDTLGNDELLGPLKLTEGQKARLYRGAVFTKVLEPAQVATLKKLTGEPLPVARGPVIVPPPTTIGGQDYSLSAMCGSVRLMQLRLIDTPAIQDELKLTAEQRKGIAELARKASATLPKRDNDRAAYRQKAEKQAAEYFEPVAKLLSEEQNRRWRQIAYQKYDMGWRGLAGLLEAKPLQEALKMTPEQVKRVTGSGGRDEVIIRQLLEMTAYRVRPVDGPLPQPLTPQAMRPVMDARLGRVLTKDQHAALKELLGEELKIRGYLPLGGGFAQPPY